MGCDDDWNKQIQAYSVLIKENIGYSDLLMTHPLVKSIVLFSVWLMLAVVGAIIHLFLSVAGMVQGILSFGLVVLTCAVVLVYRDWVQAAFLICLLAILMIVMFAGVFVEAMVNGIRDRVMDAI